MEDSGIRTSVREFAGDLFTRLAAAGDGNLVCSPYSVASVLGMLAQGARGQTLAEILAVLHADDLASLTAGLRATGEALAGRGRAQRAGQELELSWANSLWGQAGFAWDEGFLDRLGREFGAGMRTVDFADPEAARGLINAWASERTRERIPEVLPAGVLSDESRLALVNAVYFRGSWRAPFREHRTQTGDFHRLDGTTEAVPMMAGDVGDAYGEGPGWTAVDLPYAGGELAMTVVVPRAGRYGDVEQSLAGSGLGAVLDVLRPERVRVGLPRWTSRSALDLAQPLKALGIRSAFGASADLGGMTAAERLVVSAALQQAYVSVDETGTEAAAATVAVMSRMSAPLPPAHEVLADRPFLYVVHDRPTGTPLFTGRVLDPGLG